MAKEDDDEYTAHYIRPALAAFERTFPAGQRRPYDPAKVVTRQEGFTIYIDGDSLPMEQYPAYIRARQEEDRQAKIQMGYTIIANPPVVEEAGRWSTERMLTVAVAQEHGIVAFDKDGRDFNAVVDEWMRNRIKTAFTVQ